MTSDPNDKQFVKEQCALLSLCLTLKEVAITWGKSRKSVEMRVLKGSFIGRKTPSGWLISAASVSAVWGPPPLPLPGLELPEIYNVA